MARPKKGEEKGATAYIGARVPAELKEAVEAKAQQRGTSVGDEVREALEAHTNGRGAKRGRK